MKKIKMRFLLTFNFRHSTRNMGFTLIEILVVVAIIGVLATIIVINLVNAEAKSRDTKRVANLREIKTALGLYKLNEGAYPVTDGYLETKDLGSGNQKLAETLLPKGYLRAIPQDPLAPDTTYAGYLYIRYDWLSVFTAAPTLPDATRYGLFASLERPSTLETNTVSTTFPYEHAAIDYMETTFPRTGNNIYRSGGTEQRDRGFNYAMTE